MIRTGCRRQVGVKKLITGEALSLEYHPTGTTKEGFYIARVAEETIA